MPTCESAGLAISMSGCSAERLEPGHLVLAGRRHDVHHGPVSCHCRDRGQGDQRHFLTGVQQGSRLPASEHAPGGLACRFPGARRYRGLESAQPRAPPGGGRWLGRMRRSLPTLRGRRDSSRPDPAGALAAVIARAAACFDSGPGARCPSGSTCRSPRSGRGAKPPFRTTDSGDPAGRRHAISAVRRGYDVEVG